MKMRSQPSNTQIGMTLLEVLIAIMIFATGILALTQLQGSLARSASDANLRTVAINVAEEVIERHRGFSRLSKDPDGIEHSYSDIEPAEYALTRGNFSFNVDVDVSEYWYDKATQLFTTTEPLVAAYSDFKMISVRVDWGDTAEFMIDRTTNTSSALGSGEVTLNEIISSVTSAADAKSATGGTGGLYLPSIDYNPGSNPDIIPISLGQNKFKESTTPLPNVRRTDELAETTFDVVTYLQDNEGSTFLRREEFRSVSCECSLRVPGGEEGAGEGGLRPTLWDGNEYTLGERVTKTYGVGTSNVQSKFCDLCCRDHHDGGVGEDDDPDDPGRALYDPFRDASEYVTGGPLDGDHKHYFRNGSGGLSLATSHGSAYMEACRMVRKNGFWQVAQDLRQEGLNAFPENYLDSSAEVAVYSDYVTGAMDIYLDAIVNTQDYELAPPQFTPPGAMSPAVNFPASSTSNATTLPTALNTNTQQLRSRGIYVDYMSRTLRDIIDCLEQGGDGVSCGAPAITTPLEITPFYDVQTTWLTRWTESPVNNPVDVSNQAIVNNNAHSRGLASLTAGFGFTAVNTEIHKGNLGMTGTDPVDPNYDEDLRTYDLHVLALSETPPPGLNEYLISGLITSSISGFKSADVEISYTGAQCNRTSTGFDCLVEIGANNPLLTVTNYYKSTSVRVACSPAMEIQGVGTGPNGWTRFRLPTAATTTADIIIRLNSC